MKKEEILEKILQMQIGWIRAADSKLSLILPLATAMLAVLAALAPKPTDWTVLAAITSAIAAILVLLSIILSTFAHFPRTSGPKGSLVFFAGIVSRDEEQYQKAITDLEEDTYIEDLCRQSHRNAQIAEKKYYWVQKAMVSLFIAIIPWILSVYLLYNK